MVTIEEDRKYYGGIDAVGGRTTRREEQQVYGWRDKDLVTRPPRTCAARRSRGSGVELTQYFV